MEKSPEVVEEDGSRETREANVEAGGGAGRGWEAQVEVEKSAEIAEEEGKRKSRKWKWRGRRGRRERKG